MKSIDISADGVRMLSYSFFSYGFILLIAYQFNRLSMSRYIDIYHMGKQEPKTLQIVCLSFYYCHHMRLGQIDPDA
jgi:hypothetical protein